MSADEEVREEDFPFKVICYYALTSERYAGKVHIWPDEAIKVPMIGELERPFCGHKKLASRCIDLPIPESEICIYCLAVARTAMPYEREMPNYAGFREGWET